MIEFKAGNSLTTHAKKEIHIIKSTNYRLEKNCTQYVL